MAGAEQLRLKSSSSPALVFKVLTCQVNVSTHNQVNVQIGGGYVRFQTEIMLIRKLIQSAAIPSSYSINTDETNSSFPLRQRANTNLISKLLCNIKLQQ